MAQYNNTNISKIIPHRTNDRMTTGPDNLIQFK